jgi:hypothetical protein
MTLQFEMKYSTQGSGAPCHVPFSFFFGFCGIILLELQIDPQPESTTQPRLGGYSIWSAILQSHFHINFRFNNTGIVDDLQEQNLRTLGDYSRRLQDYSNISWSAFEPRDASSILEVFQLVVLMDA